MIDILIQSAAIAFTVVGILLTTYHRCSGPLLAILVDFGWFEIGWTHHTWSLWVASVIFLATNMWNLVAWLRRGYAW